MKPALFLVAIAAACSSKSSAPAPSGSAAPTPSPAPSGSAAPTPSPETSATPLTDEVNSLGQAVVAALGKSDSASLFALALTGKDVPGMFETMKKTCPDKPKTLDVDAAIKQLQGQLGADSDRETIAKTIHAECKKVADFSKATFTKATAKDAKIDCGIGSVDNVIVEASVNGQPLFLHVDDPIHTSSGWRFPENIRCATDRATL